MLLKGKSPFVVVVRVVFNYAYSIICIKGNQTIIYMCVEGEYSVCVCACVRACVCVFQRHNCIGKMKLKAFLEKFWSVWRSFNSARLYHEHKSCRSIYRRGTTGTIPVPARTSVLVCSLMSFVQDHSNIARWQPTPSFTWTYQCCVNMVLNVHRNHKAY